MCHPPPSLAGEFGRADAADGYRFRTQSARSWVEETFESPELRLFFASLGLHAGLAPDDALGAEFAWLFLCAVQDVGCSIVAGGMHQVTHALAAVLTAHGGEIRLGAEVASHRGRAGRAWACASPTASGSPSTGRSRSMPIRGTSCATSWARPPARRRATRSTRYEWGPSFFGIYAALDRPGRVQGRAPTAGAAGYLHASHPSIDALARSFADLRAGPCRPSR